MESKSPRQSCPLCHFPTDLPSTVKVEVPAEWSEGRSNVAVICSNCTTCILQGDTVRSGQLPALDTSTHQTCRCSGERKIKFSLVLNKNCTHAQCGTLKLKCSACGEERNLLSDEEEEEVTEEFEKAVEVKSTAMMRSNDTNETSPQNGDHTRFGYIGGTSYVKGAYNYPAAPTGSTTPGAAYAEQSGGTQAQPYTQPYQPGYTAGAPMASAPPCQTGYSGGPPIGFCEPGYPPPSGTQYSGYPGVPAGVPPTQYPQPGYPLGPSGMPAPPLQYSQPGYPPRPSDNAGYQYGGSGYYSGSNAQPGYHGGYAASPPYQYPQPGVPPMPGAQPYPYQYPGGSGIPGVQTPQYGYQGGAMPGTPATHVSGPRLGGFQSAGGPLQAGGDGQPPSAAPSQDAHGLWLKSLQDAGSCPTSCEYCADPTRQQSFFNEGGFVTHVMCTACGARTNWSVGDGKTTPKTLVTDLEILKPGDHIAWHRPCAIWHHAIVFDTDLKYKEIEVIHYTGGLERQDGAFASVRRQWVPVNVDDKDMYRIDYKPDECFAPPVVMTRACQRLHEADYNPFTHNCEHFARWCKTGQGRSIQIERIPIRIKKAADKLTEKITSQSWFKNASQTLQKI